MLNFFKKRIKYRQLKVNYFDYIIPQFKIYIKINFSAIMFCFHSIKSIIGSSTNRQFSEIILKNNLRSYSVVTKNFRNNLWKRNVVFLNQKINFSSEANKKTVKSSEIIQNVLDKNKEIFREKKDGLVKDIRETKTKVKEKIMKMEEVIEKENIMTIPNLLCVSRAALAPYLGYVVIQGDYKLAMGVLVVAGISDLVYKFLNLTKKIVIK